MPALCHRHPGTHAASTCEACLRSICEVCTLYSDGVTLCPECKQSRARSRSLVRLIVAGALFSMLLALGVWWSRRPHTVAAVDFDYGPRSDEVHRLQQALVAEPCDRARIVPLADAMLGAGDHRGVLVRAQAFVDRCGAYPRLRWSMYTAHMRLSEWDAAVADCGELIAGNPDDKDFWWWRAQAHEGAGRLEQAVSDYRQSLAVMPELQGVPFNLANLLERMGRPCEALFPVEQFLYYHPEARNTPSVSQHVARLYAEPACRALAGTGKASLRLRPGDAGVFATVEINGQRGHFLVDTGASLVTLTAAFASQAGVTASTQRLRVNTANGYVEAALATVDHVRLQGVEAARVAADITPSLPPGIDGLLGLSFLSRFDVRFESGRMQIEAR